MLAHFPLSKRTRRLSRLLAHKERIRRTCAKRKRRGCEVRREQDYWWMTPTEIDDPKRSGLVRLGVVREQKDFARVRNIVWRWYRREVAGRTDLTPSAKLCAWALTERWRWETYSSHDAIAYYAKMVGLHRKTCGRAITELIEKEVVWCVLEDEKRRLRKSQAGGKKHFLLVGLGYLLKEGELR